MTGKNYVSNIWCGKHTYFDENGYPIKNFPYIDPKIKNTGIGSYNLWCGNHTYFSDVDDYEMYTEEKDITIVDLETNEEYKITQKKNYPIYIID